MQIEFDNAMVEMSDEWSWKDFTAHSLLNIPSGTNVYLSCFSCEAPTPIFPSTMTGVTFYNCNLDNCIIPDGNMIIGGSNRFFLVHKDMRDWEIDEQANPIAPLDNEPYSLEELLEIK